MANSPEADLLFPPHKSKKQKKSYWDPTNLLGFSFIEIHPMDISSALRRLPGLTKKIPDRLYRRHRTSDCKNPSDSHPDSFEPAPANPNKKKAAGGNSPTVLVTAYVKKTERTISTGACFKHRRKKTPQSAPYPGCRCLHCRKLAAGIVTTPASTISKSPKTAEQATIFRQILSEWNCLFLCLDQHPALEEPLPIAGRSRKEKNCRHNGNCEEEKLPCVVYEINEPLPSNDFRSITGMISGLGSKTTDLTSSANRQGCVPTSSSNTHLQITNSPHKKSLKNVRFIDGLERNEPCEKRYPQQSRHQDIMDEGTAWLTRELEGNSAAARAVEFLPITIFKKVVSSLSADTQTILIRARSALDQSSSPSIKARVLTPEMMKVLKEDFLSFLDEKTNSLLLCRDCDLFYNKPARKTEKKEPQSFECATQYIIGRGEREDRIWEQCFRFSQVQFVMKQFRQGKTNYHDRLRGFLMASSGELSRSSYFRISEVYTVSERFLSRIQHWFHQSHDVKTPRSKAELEVLTKFYHLFPLGILCKHLLEKQRSAGHVLWDFQNEENNPNVRRCEMCALEYRYDWYDAGEHGSGLLLTVWRDFGKCLTPFDPRWVANFPEYEDPKYVKRFKKDLDASVLRTGEQMRWHQDREPAASTWPVGDIQRMFETETGFDLQLCVEGMMQGEKGKPSYFEESVRKQPKPGLTLSKPEPSG
jgi:hypothetical protein